MLSRMIITKLLRLFSELEQLFTDNEWSHWPWKISRKKCLQLFMTDRCRHDKTETTERTGGWALKTWINVLEQKPHMEHRAYPTEEHGLVGFPSQKKEHWAWVHRVLAQFQRARSLGKTVCRLAYYQLLFQHKNTQRRDPLAAHTWNNSSLPIQTEFSNIKLPVTSVCNLSV